MGVGTTTEAGFLERIEFFSLIDDPSFGKTEVYRSKQPPYQYIVDSKRSYVDDRTRMEKHMGLMNRLKNIEHPSLAHICQSEMR
jgi:hypothetical protein